MNRFFLLFSLAIALSTPSFSDDFCSTLQTVKDCAEAGCTWSDEERICHGERPAAVLAICENISSPEICDAQVNCQWDWYECVAR